MYCKLSDQYDKLADDQKAALKGAPFGAYRFPTFNVVNFRKTPKPAALIAAMDMVWEYGNDTKKKDIPTQLQNDKINEHRGVLGRRNLFDSRTDTRALCDAAVELCFQKTVADVYVAQKHFQGPFLSSHLTRQKSSLTTLELE